MPGSGGGRRKRTRKRVPRRRPTSLIERQHSLSGDELQSLRPALDFILEVARAEHRAATSARSSRKAVNCTDLHRQLKIKVRLDSITTRVRRWRKRGIWGDILEALGIGWDIGIARPRPDRSGVDAPTVTQAQVQDVLTILADHRRAESKPRMKQEEINVVPGTLNAILAIAHIERSGQHPRPRNEADRFGVANNFTGRVAGWRRDSDVWERILEVLGITWDFSLGRSQPRGSGSPPEADQATMDLPESEPPQRAPVHDVHEGSATSDPPQPQARGRTRQWQEALDRVLQTVAKADRPMSAAQVVKAVGV